MSAPKHTPGPWKLSKRSSALGDWAEVHAPTGKVVSLYDAVSDRYGHEEAANARLIAAAPELLEALKRVNAELENLADYGDDTGPNQAMRIRGQYGDLIDAVLAKAEGPDHG